MSFSTEVVIALVSLSVSSVTAMVCGYALCKRSYGIKPPLNRSVSKVNSETIKVNGPKEFKHLDLLNELELVKRELNIIRDSNTELNNKMTKTVQKILGEEWKAYYDESHQAYYWFNTKTNETTWTNPVDII
jgi:hypothetical protein